MDLPPEEGDVETQPAWGRDVELKKSLCWSSEPERRQPTAGEACVSEATDSSEGCQHQAMDTAMSGPLRTCQVAQEAVLSSLPGNPHQEPPAHVSP